MCLKLPFPPISVPCFSNSTLTCDNQTILNTLLVAVAVLTVITKTAAVILTLVMLVTVTIVSLVLFNQRQQLVVVLFHIRINLHTVFYHLHEQDFCSLLV